MIQRKIFKSIVMGALMVISFTPTITDTTPPVIQESIVKAEEPEWQGYREYEVPNIDTSFKSFMDYRTITSRGSRQYQLQQQAYTDESGFRRIGKYYLVAMGTYYSEQAGKKFIVELENGNTIFVMTGDIKQDVHTDENNQYVLHNGNVIEFIVDGDDIPDKFWVTGSVGHGILKGQIKSIKEKL